MSEANNIFLVGPMGAGKSTIGRKLANILRIEFLDSDQEIERRTGATIPWIFDVEGESGFRAREKAMIDQLSQKKPIVLATGGGAILDPENRQHLSDRGVVIYLFTSVDQQLRRTGRDQNRPLLQTENPRETLQQLFEQRDPLYRECATQVVSTDGRNVNAVVNEVLQTMGIAKRTSNRGRR